VAEQSWNADGLDEAAASVVTTAIRGLPHVCALLVVAVGPDEIKSAQAVCDNHAVEDNDFYKAQINGFVESLGTALDAHTAAKRGG
jgi:hypothetical protein